MAIIYMRNPQGGCKVAIAEEEAVEDEKNGWVRYNPATSLAPVSPAPDLDDLRDLWKAKYGKMPHHKKTAETLRKELEDVNSSGRD